MPDFTDSAGDNGLKAALAELAPFLPSQNDRSKATSLANWQREFSAPQRFFAKQLIERAEKFRALGSVPASVDGSLWDDEDTHVAPQPQVARHLLAWRDLADAGKKVEAIKEYRLQYFADLRTAKTKVEEYLARRVHAPAWPTGQLATSLAHAKCRRGKGGGPRGLRCGEDGLRAGPRGDVPQARLRHARA